MECKVIKTDRAPAAIGPYSQAITVGPWMFVSGQLGIVPGTGELVSAQFALQARQALENMRQIVMAGGWELNRVVAVDVFLTDIADFAQFNEIYQEYFSDHRPARAVVAVKALPKGACVEIKCIVNQGSL